LLIILLLLGQPLQEAPCLLLQPPLRRFKSHWGKIWRNDGVGFDLMSISMSKPCKSPGCVSPVSHQGVICV